MKWMVGCKWPTSMGRWAWCLPPLCAYYNLEKLLQQLWGQLAQPSPALCLLALMAYQVTPRISFHCVVTRPWLLTWSAERTFAIVTFICIDTTNTLWVEKPLLSLCSGSYYDDRALLHGLGCNLYPLHPLPLPCPSSNALPPTLLQSYLCNCVSDTCSDA